MSMCKLTRRLMLTIAGLLLVTSASFCLAQTTTTTDDVQVSLRDACDPTTFNAAVEPGTCVDHLGGKIAFSDFVAELTDSQSAGAWRFTPSVLNSPRDIVFTLTNKGGETHTFTRVQEFGGGFVPFLNQLSGNPVPAPECTVDIQTLQTFVAPGQTVAGPKLTAGESAKYQCCVHPWMRLSVNATPVP